MIEPLPRVINKTHWRVKDKGPKLSQTTITQVDTGTSCHRLRNRPHWARYVMEYVVKITILTPGCTSPYILERVDLDLSYTPVSAMIADIYCFPLFKAICDSAFDTPQNGH